MAELVLPDHCGEQKTAPPPNVTVQFSGGCSNSYSGYPSRPLSRAAGTSRSISRSSPGAQVKQEVVPPVVKAEVIPELVSPGVKAHVKRELASSTANTQAQAQSNCQQPTFSRFPKTVENDTPGPGAYNERGHGSIWGRAVETHAFAAREHLQTDNRKLGPGQYNVADVTRTVRSSAWKLPTSQRLVVPIRFAQQFFPPKSRPYTAPDDVRARRDACKRPATTDMYRRHANEMLQPTPWEEALLDGLPPKQSLRIHDDQVVITPNSLPQDYNVKLLGSSTQEYQSVKKKNRLEEVMLQRLARVVRREYRMSSMFR
eukprot:GEMP01053366.1.p1 GENE.GEMP01053366.1~~GEMP01053366.1.p1  ORF type:complete len:315 (+),score=59.42 GEMP01053366.1:107-1051(+)